MAGIFSINSNPIKIITKHAKKEFKGQKINSNSYLEIQNCLIGIYSKRKKTELNEEIMAMEMEIQLDELENFDIFTNSRLGFYALFIAIFALVISNKEIVNFSTEHIEKTIYCMISFLGIVLVSSRYVSDLQKERLLYMKFKLKSLKIALEKNNKRE